MVLRLLDVFDFVSFCLFCFRKMKKRVQSWGRLDSPKKLEKVMKIVKAKNEKMGIKAHCQSF